MKKKSSANCHSNVPLGPFTLPTVFANVKLFFFLGRWSVVVLHTWQMFKLMCVMACYRHNWIRRSSYKDDILAFRSSQQTCSSQQKKYLYRVQPGRLIDHLKVRFCITVFLINECIVLVWEMVYSSLLKIERVHCWGKSRLQLNERPYIPYL